MTFGGQSRKIGEFGSGMGLIGEREDVRLRRQLIAVGQYDATAKSLHPRVVLTSES